MRHVELSIGALDLDEFAVDATGPAHGGRNIHRRTDSVFRIGAAYEEFFEAVCN
jgi:hypothetical protein